MDAGTRQYRLYNTEHSHLHVLTHSRDHPRSASATLRKTWLHALVLCALQTIASFAARATPHLPQSAGLSAHHLVAPTCSRRSAAIAVVIALRAAVIRSHEMKPYVAVESIFIQINSCAECVCFCDNMQSWSQRGCASVSLCRNGVLVPPI